MKYNLHLKGSPYSNELYNEKGGEHFESEQEAIDLVKKQYNITENDFEIYPVTN